MSWGRGEVIKADETGCQYRGRHFSAGNHGRKADNASVFGRYIRAGNIALSSANRVGKSACWARPPLTTSTSGIGEQTVG